MRLNYIEATETDVPFLLSLRLATMDQYLMESGQQLSTEDHLLRVKYKMSTAHLIQYNSQIIGMIKYEQSVSELTIHQIQLLPEHQGKGFGQHILNTFIERANTHNIPILLSVLKVNPAKSFYFRLGFVQYREDEHELYLRLN